MPASLYPLLLGGLCFLAHGAVWHLLLSLSDTQPAPEGLMVLSVGLSSTSLNGSQLSRSTSPRQESAVEFMGVLASCNSMQGIPEPCHFDCSPKPVPSLVVKEIWGQMVWNWNHILTTLSQMLAYYFGESPHSSVALMLIWWRSASEMWMLERQGW